MLAAVAGATVRHLERRELDRTAAATAQMSTAATRLDKPTLAAAVVVQVAAVAL
jgi:hypothetical protein